MLRIRRALGLIVLLGLAALFPTTALAAGGMPGGWPGSNLQAAFLGLLAPLALILLAVGATPPSEAREMVSTAFATLVVGVVAYVACGFAFQFGGVGLQVSWPGLAGLVSEWTPLDPALGLGWGAVGLQGFLLGGGAATPDAYALAATQLPAVAVAVLIPTLALARRVRRGVLLGVAAVVAGVLFPVIGNWVWGGGWLALLGLNAGLGHGFVDLGGSATLHLLGAGAALAGILIFGRRRPAPQPGEPIELPPVHFPLFVLIGGLLAPVGWLGLVLANPLLTADVAPGLVAVNLMLGAVSGAAPGLFYSWLATGRLDPQLAARGLVAGLAASGAGCGFMPPLAALAAGVLAGMALPMLLYWVDRGLHWEDPNATLATHGLPGLLGVLWLALFANGRWGVGWNGVPSRFGLLEQGVAGLFVAPGYASDIPGQLWAQLAGAAGVLVLAVGIPLLILGLLRAARAVARWTRPEPRTMAYRARKR